MFQQVRPKQKYHLVQESNLISYWHSLLFVRENLQRLGFHSKDGNCQQPVSELIYAIDQLLHYLRPTCNEQRQYHPSHNFVQIARAHDRSYLRHHPD